MADLSSRSMRFALNNTRIFSVQGFRSATRHALLALGIAGLAAGAGAGCRSAKKPPKEAVTHAVGRPDLTPPRAEPPPAGTLPDPSAVPAPPHAPAGTLRVHLDAEPANLHPFASADAAVRAVTDGLVYQTLIDCTGGTYRPLLSDSWDVSDDGMRIALHMRAGVRWHDHHAFGVLDVQATLEPLLRKSKNKSLEASILGAELDDVDSVELVSERTIRLVLKRPSDLALRALCDVPILPDHLVRDVRPEASPIAKQPVGTGPFRFAAWERGKRIRLQRAPDAWGPAPVGVEEIVFDLDTDGVRALNRTRRGDLDILPRVLDVHYPDQVEPSTLHGMTELYRLTPERTSFLVVNHRHEPLGDVRVRRAIALLWDRERFARELHKDLARPIGGPVFGAEVDIAAPRFDRARAIKLLDEAGYRDTNADGVRDREGRPIRLTFLEVAGSRTLPVEAHAFALEMRKAGLLVDVVATDAATVQARLQRGDFDLAPMMWEEQPDEDPSPLFGEDGAYNYGGYRSSALAPLWDRLRVARGAAGRRPLLAEIARIIADEQPVIFLYRTDVPALVSTRVHGLAAVGDRLDLSHVWLDP
jgi:peptide/nickel transport system substrate-binding protein